MAWAPAQCLTPCPSRASGQGWVPSFHSTSILSPEMGWSSGGPLPRRHLCLCWPALPSSPEHFSGGGVGVPGLGLPSWRGRGNQGATGQWAMNYSETPDAWPEQGAG